MECSMFVLCGVVWVTWLVGFIYIEYVSFVCFGDGSRKFILLLTSVSKVKFNFGCSLLMYLCSCFVCCFRCIRILCHQHICTNIWFLSAYLLQCWLSMCICPIWWMNILAKMQEIGELMGRPSGCVTEIPYWDILIQLSRSIQRIGSRLHSKRQL